MTRETWKRARTSFDRAFEEFAATVQDVWDQIETREDAA